MTKFILHGGNAREINPDNDSFFREMTRGLGGKVKVLLNYLAREDSEAEECAEQDKARWGDVEAQIANSANLAEQIKWCEVIYMRGGDSVKLTEVMSQVKDLNRLFENKVIAGSSAGVYVLSKYFWENDPGELHEGLGILNLKAYCHHKPEDTEIVRKLSEYKEELPLLLLPKYKWLVMYEKYDNR